MTGMLAIAAAILFVATNGFFVAAEFALVKVRAAQLAANERKGDRRAAVAQSIVLRLDRYLGVTQFGITVASLGLGWVVEPAVAKLIERIPMDALGGALARYAPALVVAIAFSCLTVVHVLLGELVPKLYAIQRTEQTALFVARPIRFTYVVFRPLLWILEAATGFILRAIGLSANVASHADDSEADVLSILAVTMRRSPQGREKSDLVERVVRFSRRAARHAMVPRVDVVSLPIDTPGGDAAQLLRKQGFSRVILTRGRSLDVVEGYLYAKDFWLDPAVERARDLSGVRRDVLFVPETQGALDVMRQMQREETPIAIVVDEYGGTSGLLTMEDLLEEIVGEIRDELDEEPAKIARAGGEHDAWDIDGRTTLEELRPLGVEVLEADAAESVGSVVVERLGRLPRVKDRVVIAGHTVEVIGVQKRRVLRVRLWATRAEPPQTSDDARVART